MVIPDQKIDRREWIKAEQPISFQQPETLVVRENAIAHPSNFSKLAIIAIIALELLLAFPISLPFSKLGIGGVAWIFGGIVSGAFLLNVYRILYKVAIPPNKNTRKLGQILVGLVIGFAIANGNLANIADSFPLFIFLTLFILLTGVLIGYIYSRISQTNLLNAMFATTPGGVGIMSSMAADYGGNVSLVALVQVIRVTSVISIVPLLVRLLMGQINVPNKAGSQNLFNFHFFDLIILIFVLLITILMVCLASYLKIPAAPFFGAIVVGLSFNYLIGFFTFIANFDFTPPRIVNLVGQALLGISIGEYWGNKPNLDKRTIAYAFIPVIMTILAGFLTAGIAYALTPWDWLTCILVTAPGGSTEMILVALALNHNVEIVTAGHLVRLIALNTSLPLWLLLFRYLDRLLPNSGDNE